MVKTGIKVDHSKAVYLTKDLLDMPDTSARVIRYDGRSQPVVDALREILLIGTIYKNVMGPISGTGTTTVVLSLA